MTMTETTQVPESDETLEKSKSSLSWSRLTQAMKSVCAAFFGVQTEEKHKQDFEKLDQPFTYVIAAIILASLFISCLFILIFWITRQY